MIMLLFNVQFPLFPVPALSVLTRCVLDESSEFSL